jgi:DNA-binding IclR family transcriptional regulator
LANSTAARPRNLSTNQYHPSKATSYQSHSDRLLDEAFDIVSAFSHECPKLSLKLIIAQANLPKTTVFRVLSTLAERHFCEFDTKTELYSLGFSFLHFGDICLEALPVTRNSRNELNETVVLSIQPGDSLVHIELVRRGTASDAPDDRSRRSSPALSGAAMCIRSITANVAGSASL